MSPPEHGAPTLPQQAGGTLWLTPSPREVPAGDVAVVVDLAWTPPRNGAGAISVRDVASRVLARLDPMEATLRLLDAWAAASGVIESLTIGTTSFWYRHRLDHWQWLQEHVVWAEILRELVREHRPAGIACAAGTDEALRTVARMVAVAEQLPFMAEPEPPAPPMTMSKAAPAEPGRRRPLPIRIARRFVRAVRSRLHIGATESAAWQRFAGETVQARVARLAAAPEPRLLVVLMQLPHRVATPAGARVIHPNLEPIIDRLRGTRLDPIVVDRHFRLRESGPGDDRVLPLGAVPAAGPPHDAAAEQRALDAAQAIADVRLPVITGGIDLGPSLARRVADDASTWIREAHVGVAAIRALVDRLQVRAILVADEYHRQECLEAASMTGIPVAAVQHGTIYGRHPGYIHRERPPQLHLADRTYVFGRWEQDLLTGTSVYRDDEVVVGGSPRLDLYRPVAGDREAARAELGVRAGERLIVLSGTYNSVSRRFHYPLLLARLFDRPLPNVRLVVKQHPAEPDEGPYRAVIEGVAAVGGFAPPPISFVQHVDLYRLLAAADAHLGIHSTVLMEAVFVGTPNLLATGVLGSDLLDYVAAGVALPVANGAELLEALSAAARGAITTAAQEAFIASHFEPGSATDRIAADLLAWLT